jgi:hypothetical protein
VSILLALLAFAVTMLALATVVTTFLEVATRFIGSRFRVFTQMLRLVFEREIQPILERSVPARGAANGGDIAAFLERQWQTFHNEITCSPLEPHKDPSRVSKLSGWMRWLGAARSEELTTEEFVRRLARSEVGKTIYGEAATQIDQVVERITTRYEEMAAAAREYFKNSSVVVSLVIGIVFALVYNIDATRIFQFYLANPEVAASMADQAEATLKQFDVARARLAEAQAALTPPPVPAAATAPAPDAQADDAKKQAQAQIEQARLALEASRTRVAAFQSQGLPIGFNQFPHCVLFKQANDAVPLCETQKPTTADKAMKLSVTDLVAWSHLGHLLLWLVIAVGTGALIGLGGPFWYDAVVGLMRATQTLRGRAEPAQSAAGTPGAAAPAATPAETFVKHVDTPPPATTYGGPLWRPVTPPPAHTP